MNNEMNLLTSFLNQLEILQNFYEPPESIGDQFCSFINNFNLALEAAGMKKEKATWESYMSNTKFFFDDSSLPGQMFSAKGILLGMINRHGVNGQMFFEEKLIDSEKFEDAFYDSLIDEVNFLYIQGRPISLLIQIRKLLENLIIDILRKQFGKNEISLYFNSSKGRFQDFSVVVKNFSIKAVQLKYTGVNIDEKLINAINEFREKGNASAHSLDNRISIDEIRGQKELINHIVNTLVHMYRNIIT